MIALFEAVKQRLPQARVRRAQQEYKKRFVSLSRKDRQSGKTSAAKLTLELNPFKQNSLSLPCIKALLGMTPLLLCNRGSLLQLRATGAVTAFAVTIPLACTAVQLVVCIAVLLAEQITHHSQLSELHAQAG